MNTKLPVLILTILTSTIMVGMERDRHIPFADAREIVAHQVATIIPLTDKVRDDIDTQLLHVASEQLTIANDILDSIANDIVNNVITQQTAPTPHRTTQTSPRHPQLTKQQQEAALAHQLADVRQQQADRARKTQQDMDHALALQLSADNQRHTSQPRTIVTPQLQQQPTSRSQDIELSGQAALTARTQAVITPLNRPVTLTANTSYTIVPTSGQKGATCGGHAVINARAIQELFDAQQPITANAIKQRASRYVDTIPGNNLETKILYDFANQLSVPIFILYINDANQVAPASTYRLHDFATLMHDLNNPHKRLCEHFIFNTGGHWVVASIIKEKNQLPHLYYQDSGNVNGHPLAPHSADYTFVSSLLGIMTRR